MADPTIYMQFLSKAVPDGTLAVIRMDGAEELSRPYRFTIELVSSKPDLDLDKILEQPATLTLRRGDAAGGRRTAQTLRIHGALEVFEQLDPGPNWFNYRAVLVPRLQFLKLTCQSRIFQEQSIPAIVTEVLKGAGLTTADFEFKTSGTHPTEEYVVQYQESDFDFVSRLLEHEGIYYFFAQEGEHEKIVFTDNPNTPKPVATEPNVPFRLGAGLADMASSDAEFHEETVRSLLARRSAVPQKVVLKDYNYRKPSVDLKAEASVSPKGKGTVYEFGDHFKDAAQGNDLAKIRAEEIRCRAKWFEGRGDHRAFRAGFTFRLKDHARGDFNANYLLTRVTHSGRQRIALGPTSAGEGWEYANEFAAIPADVVFRPERATPWPRVHGAINALVDAGSSGEYAEIDDHGRYKVKLPFDLSDRKDGKASRYIRMAQPYAGADMGMHFPLHKGTEVMLTHIDGDPDRPVIAAAVPNAETVGPVTGSNQSQCAIRTGGGNQIVMEDQGGNQRIKISTPHQGSTIQIGSPNLPGDGISVFTNGDYLTKVIGNIFDTTYANKNVEVKGNETTLNVGNVQSQVFGNKTEQVKGHYTGSIIGSKTEKCVGARQDLNLSQFNTVIVGVTSETRVGWGYKFTASGETELNPVRRQKIQLEEHSAKLQKEDINTALERIHTLRRDVDSETAKLKRLTSTVDSAQLKYKRLDQSVEDAKRDIKKAHDKIQELRLEANDLKYDVRGSLLELKSGLAKVKGQVASLELTSGGAKLKGPKVDIG